MVCRCGGPGAAAVQPTRTTRVVTTRRNTHTATRWCGGVLCVVVLPYRCTCQHQPPVPGRTRPGAVLAQAAAGHTTYTTLVGPAWAGWRIFLKPSLQESVGPATQHDNVPPPRYAPVRISQARSTVPTTPTQVHRSPSITHRTSTRSPKPYRGVHFTADPAPQPPPTVRGQPSAAAASRALRLRTDAR